jgi:hypothetical protein
MQRRRVGQKKHGAEDRKRERVFRGGQGSMLLHVGREIRNCCLHSRVECKAHGVRSRRRGGRCRARMQRRRETHRRRVKRKSAGERSSRRHRARCRRCRPWLVRRFCGERMLQQRHQKRQHRCAPAAHLLRLRCRELNHQPTAHLQLLPHLAHMHSDVLLHAALRLSPAPRAGAQPHACTARVWTHTSASSMSTRSCSSLLSAGFFFALASGAAAAPPLRRRGGGAERCAMSSSGEREERNSSIMRRPRGVRKMRTSFSCSASSGVGSRSARSSSKHTGQTAAGASASAADTVRCDASCSVG